MGRVKHLKKVMDFLKKSPIVSSRDIVLIVKNRNYAYLLSTNLIKKQVVKRIVKGFYSCHEDPIVTVFCFKPSYIGLQEALSFHDLWEQETSTVVITTKRVRPGLRKVFDSNVILHRINPKYLFGYELINYENFHIPVSDIEKTLIDLVYFNEIPDNEVLRRINKRIDHKKLQKYLKPYPEKFKKKVLKLIHS
jgi:predicted transcriptional regulator of viral defense system